MREIAHELLCKQDISLLLKELSQRALGKTNNVASRNILKTVILFFTRAFDSPELYMRLISTIKLNNDDLFLALTQLINDTAEVHLNGTVG